MRIIPLLVLLKERDRDEVVTRELVYILVASVDT